MAGSSQNGCPSYGLIFLYRSDSDGSSGIVVPVHAEGISQIKNMRGADVAEPDL